MAKELAILSNGWLENMIVKMGVCCCKYSRGRRRRNINISTIMARMAEPIF